jgi:hypothetical protein
MSTVEETLRTALKRRRLCINWLSFEYKVLTHALGHRPSPAEHREHTFKILAAIWDDDEQTAAGSQPDVTAP